MVGLELHKSTLHQILRKRIYTGDFDWIGASIVATRLWFRLGGYSQLTKRAATVGEYENVASAKGVVDPFWQTQSNAPTFLETKLAPVLAIPSEC